MSLLSIDELGDVLDTAQSDLYRWETLPAYEVASDGSDYRRYLDGAAEPTWQRKQPWLDTLRAWAQQGRPRRRVRVIHSPITSYERYACEWGYALNSAAGEQIRIIDLSVQPLPREVEGIGDFWLVNQSQPVLMHYADDGQFVGAELVLGRAAAPLIAAAQAAWLAASDFGSWWARHPEHHRAAHRAA